jgi:hypothetical protein
VKPIFGRTRDSDDHMGWVFPATTDEEPGAEPDPFNAAKTVRELYEIASTNYTGKPTVPVSLDLGTIPLLLCFSVFPTVLLIIVVHYYTTITGLIDNLIAYPILSIIVC